MLETCADAFGRKRLGHAHRPPGRMGAGLDSQARFSRLGATLVAHRQTNILKTIRKPFARRQEFRTGYRRIAAECKSMEMTILWAWRQQAPRQGRVIIPSVERQFGIGRE